jgi:OmpA-OmpF porin, OOP family
MRGIKKNLAPILLCAMTAALSACATSHANRGASNSVGVETEFPNPGKAVLKEGTFPTVDHLRNMAPGLTKNQVYDLLGKPHFREGVFGVREWNYIFHFRHNGQVLTCQYKVLFDDDKQVSSTHWSTDECAAITEEPALQVPAAAKEPVRINLSGDALFAYSRSGPADILAGGRAELAAIVAKLKSSQEANIQVIGYTDRIGSDSANLALSQRRAETVRDFLIANGIAGGSIVARGAGESSPIAQCSDSLRDRELVDCLQPDRRVELLISALD